jgi:two-component system, chemotaxis family, protein-glutamate methylesterase/glutaminase
LPRASIDTTACLLMTRLVLIGASSGGVTALTRLTAGLPADFAAPVLVVLHIGAHRSILPELLSKRCPLDVAHGRDGEALRPGMLRVAPPDLHMTVSDGTLRLRHGPKENYARPAIDPLFRSAALQRGRGAVGVVLTGALDDGTAGLQAIKAMGGTTVVQDPADAEEPSMPASALRHTEVDHCLPLERMPGLLAELAAASIPDEPASPSSEQKVKPELAHELALMQGTGEPVQHLQAIGHPSMFTCPECQGGLWEVQGTSPRRYRCHTGHGFTERTLLHAMSNRSDDALWGALRALQEKQAMLAHAAAQLDPGDDAGRVQAVAAARRVARQVHTLRQLLQRAPPPIE